MKEVTKKGDVLGMIAAAGLGGSYKKINGN